MTYPTEPIVLSYVQADLLLQARKQAQTKLDVSPDLGITMVPVTLADTGITFAQGEQLSWEQVEKIKRSDVTCFRVETDTIYPIQYFSEATNRMCSLLPTKQTPSMLIAGFTMHRIVAIDPMQDTLKKIATLKPITGLGLYRYRGRQNCHRGGNDRIRSWRTGDRPSESLVTRTL
jgi:predicted methyltransferase